MTKRDLLLSITLVLPVLWLTATADGGLSDQLEQAQAYVKDAKYAEAEAIYRQIVTDYPGTDDAFAAQRKLPSVLLAMGRESDAEAALQKLLVDFATKERLPHAVHEMAEDSHKLGKTDKARELCQNLLGNPAVAGQAIWLQMGEAISCAIAGDETAAIAAAGTLCTQFAKDDRSAEAVCQVAWCYRKSEKYRRSRELYQYVADNWPDKPRAIFSLRGVALTSISLAEYPHAAKTVEGLLADFSGNAHLAEVISSVADAYRALEKYDEVRRLHRYIVANCPESEQAIWSLRSVALASIGLGDEAAAQEATDTLLTRFSGHKQLTKVIYQIARNLKNDHKSGMLFEKVVDNDPNSDLAILAKANLGNIKLRSGNEVGAQEVLDGLLADYAEHPVLPKAVALMAGAYYEKGLTEEREGHKDLARESFEKAIGRWNKVIAELPETPYTTAEACYFTAVSYGRMGQDRKATDYYQRVADNWPDFPYAWSALFRVGRRYENLLRLGDMTAEEAEPRIRTAYEQLLQRYPACKVAATASRWLRSRRSR